MPRQAKLNTKRSSAASSLGDSETADKQYTISGQLAPRKGSAPLIDTPSDVFDYEHYVKSPGRSVKLDQLLVLMTKHKLSMAQSARVLKVSNAAVTQMLKRHGLTQKDISDRAEWSEDKIGRLESLQWRIQQAVNREQIQKDGARNHVVSMGILEDKLQNLRGQTGHNYPTSIQIQVVNHSGDRQESDVIRLNKGDNRTKDTVSHPIDSCNSLITQENLEALSDNVHYVKFPEGVLEGESQPRIELTVEEIMPDPVGGSVEGGSDCFGITPPDTFKSKGLISESYPTSESEVNVSPDIDR